MLVTVLTVFTILTGVVLGANQDCVDHFSDVSFKPEDVEGTWYPMEIVLHRNDSKIYGVPVETQCPVVTFSINKKKSIIMVWNATEGDVEYKFVLKSGSKSQWQSTADQSGALVNDQYKHYGGFMRLLKLENDYMFLSFCSSKYRLLNTVAFSRNDEMPAEVFEKVLEMLDAKHYKRAKEIHVRPCVDEDGSSQRVLATWLLTLLLSLVVRFSH